MNTVCTHRPDPTGRGVDREQLYWELSQLTQGITKLGPYTLDQDSLYINGEQQPCLFCCITKPLFFPYTCFIPLFIPSLHPAPSASLPSPSAGYTYHTSETTPSGEYRVVFRSRYVTRDARSRPLTHLQLSGREGVGDTAWGVIAIRLSWESPQCCQLDTEKWLLNVGWVDGWRKVS